MGKDKLYDILVVDDVVKSINENLDYLLELIPELKSMIGFEHKHSYHHLDVWNHTLLALSYSPNDFYIRVVLLLHDIGKPFSYQEGDIRHFKGHPRVSANMSFIILNRLGFESDEILKLCNLIEEHDNLITNEEIDNNLETTIIKFKIQCCDALAHNPLKLEKRIRYLLSINDKINNESEREIYLKFINRFMV